MGCMVLCRTFHIAPGQGQALTPIVPYCSGSSASPGHSQCDYTITLLVAVSVSCTVCCTQLLVFIFFLARVILSSYFRIAIMD